ncbi:uncharacterized protein BXZ73DRAFT_87563 [Epithele typhae]|uniref:uncharacterized protein n=1 Tax=Epithele typhae TaxID=378194 RepID=UPI002007D6C9|nr:uncharacterized protein BXZ73DRAFT_87563 [Epithele typhae]KAH9943172.1 hypothetical protein BXZ73DRAFT_87563 [Epithele typhae]
MSPTGNKTRRCHKCGQPMKGHKRPGAGVVVCPIGPTGSPAPTETTEIVAPSAAAGPSRAPQARKDDFFAPQFVLDISSSGYGHRVNPNFRPDDVQKPISPPRRDNSWVSTELDERSAGSPARRPRRNVPGIVQETIARFPSANSYMTIPVRLGDHIIHEREEGYGGHCEDDYEEEEEYEANEENKGDSSDTQSATGKSTGPTLMQRMTRSLSTILGRDEPHAVVYRIEREDARAAEARAVEQGMYCRVAYGQRHITPVAGPSRSESIVKPEPTTPHRLTDNDGMCWFAIGDNRDAVDAAIEPYLEPTGALAAAPCRDYPIDPRTIRPNFVDTLVAGAVGGLVVFYCLSVA